MAQTDHDYLKQFPQLKGRELLAGDGHSIKHATHAEKSAKGRYLPSETLYVLDLHTGLSRSMAPVGDTTRKGNDWKALKNSLEEFKKELPGAAGAPILIYDRAGSDLQFWTEQKLMKDGIEGIVRLKKNMVPLIKEPVKFDRGAPINTGIIEEYMTGFNNTCTMRLIHYRDPESETEYHFLTTNSDLPPGLIAWLYFLRWRIEKVFDVYKNIYREQKAWATSPGAQIIQSSSISALHNILVHLRVVIKQDHQLEEEKLKDKRLRWIKAREEKAAELGRSLHPLTYSHPIMQLSAQFVRSVRNTFSRAETIRALLPIFKRALAVYI